MITEGDEISDPSGMDDNQMPAFCVVPGLFAFDHSAKTINNAAQVISTNTDVIAGVAAVRQCLVHLVDGRPLSEALSLSANEMQGDVGQLMQEALTVEQYQPLVTAKRFGLACYVERSLPVVWHLLHNATDFESAVLDNVRCGGDNCGRSMALGAIAGLAFGVPQDLVNRMAGQRIPITI